MKKCFFVAVLLLMASATFAQFNFGIKAGYNSSLTFNNISDVQSGTYTLKNVGAELNNGFHVGVFSRIGTKMYIQPEVLYSLQNKNYQITMQDVTNKEITVDKLVSFSTVDIPLLLGYKLLDLKVANLRVFAGPKLRLNAGSEVSFPSLTDGSGIDKEKLIGEFKNSQIGLEAGAGIDVLMFTLDCRFNLINDVYQATWQTKPDLNSNFVISLGWKLF